ncbi:MAG: hypothetical protein LBC71_00565 [Oscillospiraceae bacterium]|jgi:hypothetical protein|nr:hypothetical protein [Oscillospiraceae bacterium]
MGSKISLRAIWYTARSEFLRWITNPRIIIVGILIVCIYTLAVEPLLERVERFGEPLNMLEPFIAVGNSGILVMLMPCVFIILISDFPVINPGTLPFIIRAGKHNWFFGQMLFMIICIIVFILIIFVSCALMSQGTFSSHWSDTVTKFNAEFPDEMHHYASELLPSNLYNQVHIFTALFTTILMMVLYFIFLALILCIAKMLYLHSAGIFSVFSIISLGVMTTALRSPLMWIFPMANTIVWLHYHEILRQPVRLISTSILYFAVLITVSTVINLIILKRLQFTNIEYGSV